MRNSLLLLIIIISISCNLKQNNGGGGGFDSINSIDEGKSLITSSLENYQSKYLELCGGKRNDDLKYEYQEINNSIHILYEIGNNCKNLSYQEQNQLTQFVMDELEKFPDLKKLSQTGNVNCW